MLTLNRIKVNWNTPYLLDYNPLSSSLTWIKIPNELYWLHVLPTPDKTVENSNLFGLQPCPVDDPDEIRWLRLKIVYLMISLCENVQGSTLLYLWRKNHFAAHFGDMKRMGIWNLYYLACNLDSQMNTRLCRMIVILPSLLEIISTLYHCGGTWMLLPSLVTPPVRLVVSFCTLKLCNKIFYIL